MNPASPTHHRYGNGHIRLKGRTSIHSDKQVEMVRNYAHRWSQQIETRRSIRRASRAQ